MVQLWVVTLDRPGFGSCLHQVPVTLVGSSELRRSYFKNENDGSNDHLTDLQRALSERANSSARGLVGRTHLLLTGFVLALEPQSQSSKHTADQ